MKRDNENLINLTRKMVMKRNVKLLGTMAMLSMALASCTTDELKEVYQGEKISFTTRMTRAVATTTNNLKAFRVYADADGYPDWFIDGDTARRDGNSNIFSILSKTGGSYFWPSDVKKIKFWAYGPIDPDNSENSINIKPNMTVGTQSFEHFSPSSDDDKDKKHMIDGGKSHKDFIVAYAEAERGGTNTDGTTVELHFNHALSQIVVKAKCPDVEKNVKIRGAWLMNVKSTGLLVFQDGYVNNMKWTTTADLGNYGVTLGSVKEVTPRTDYSFLIGSNDEENNTSLMLVPQKDDAVDMWNPDSNPDGAYILLLCRVEAVHKGATHTGGSTDDVLVEGNKHIHQLFPVRDKYNAKEYGYTCVAIEPDWEPGKKYVYNLEFCGPKSGAGVYPPENVGSTPGLPANGEDLEIVTKRPDDKNVGDPVLDNPIKFKVDVIDWDNGNVPDIPMP
ncbi:fimbrillin family protein [uncultured Bacteroides sp.]|uniref:fimbrillin family protein n=1 Tax=uncultured Bacteroides sp. TaxID=162156 RepID=UPI0025884021|nr:fimbrillin family protein [uncultured Bacteroides sp.]